MFLVLRPRFAAACIALAVLALPSSAPRQQARAPDRADFLSAIARHAKSGDVIFITTPDLWSDLARVFSRKDHRFSHVGMLVNRNGWRVIDAGRGVHVVHETPLETFLAGASDMALYRAGTSSERQRARAVAFAERAAARQLAFDDDFSLATDQKLYCSELIWRAWASGIGADPVPHKSSAVGNPYIALDDLSGSDFLTEVWSARVSPRRDRSNHA